MHISSYMYAYVHTHTHTHIKCIYDRFIYGINECRRAVNDNNEYRKVS